MWKSYQVHYKNKYPKCQVKYSETSFDVFDYSGEHHLVSLRKNGAGQVVDVSEEHGCFEKHDLSPIPKESRRYKLYPSGKVAPSEEYIERKKWMEENHKLSAHGYPYIEDEKTFEKNRVAAESQLRREEAEARALAKAEVKALPPVVKEEELSLSDE